MKIRSIKYMILMVGICTCLGGQALAAITPTSDNFNSDTNTFPNWVSVGTTNATFLRDTSSDWDWWDGDDSTFVGAYNAGTNMVVTGDGLLYDGGLRIDTQDSIPGDEAVGLTIGGTMETNTVIMFTGNFYNDNSSYTDVKAQLWNETDGTLLADTGPTRVLNYNNNAYTPVDFSLSYSVTAADQGDQLQIRFVDAGTDPARDVYVDNFSVISTQAVSLAWTFNNDGPTGSIITNNVAQYDYTSAQAYVASNAVPNTLAFNGRSSSTDYIIRDKGPGHERALYFKTLNTASPDFGIYIQKLDFTANGQNTNKLVKVNWSFDILGYDSNGNIDPSNWTVKVAMDNNSESLNVSDSWYSSAVLAQTFSFNDDSTGETAQNGTWTTISGSAVIPVGTGGKFGGIQISTDGGGYTSAGGIFLDNINVFISTIPSQVPQMFASWVTNYYLSYPAGQGYTDDPDGDNYNNIWEFAMGGNPIDGADIGYVPQFFKSTNAVYYVYPIRDAAVNAGLVYKLLTTTNLVSGSWSNSGVEMVGKAVDGYGPGFSAVTNRISTDVQNQQFIRLSIEGF